MKAIVTVFKTELKNREFVHAQLKSLSRAVVDVDTAIVYSPLQGKVVEFLSVLRFNKIAYGTHFDTKDAPETIEA